MRRIRHPQPSAAVNGQAVQFASGKTIAAVAMRPEGNGYRTFMLKLPVEAIDAFMWRNNEPQLLDECVDYLRRFAEGVAEENGEILAPPEPEAPSRWAAFSRWVLSASGLARE